jgi:hypothetical protein
MRIFIRLLASPFILGLYAVYMAVSLIKSVFQFIRYGGEAIVYGKNEPKKLTEIY